MMLRLAPFAVPVALVACASRSEPAEPISTAESAVTTASVESTVVAMSPITSADAATIAASYQAMYPQLNGVDGGSCATVETDNRTFVRVTFACSGPLATTGELMLAITSLTTVEATANLTIGQTAIDGSVVVTIPASASTPRTLEGDLVIAGPERELDASASASWLVNGTCVTYSASGSVSVGTASKTFEITNRTACRE